MKVLKGNLFKPDRTVDAICITTNFCIKRTGDAVMGAGVALEATRRFPGIARALGKKIRSGINETIILGKYPINNVVVHVVSFPTKVHWKYRSLPELIYLSSIQLETLTTNEGWSNVWLPKPGCKNGGLQWPLVKSIIEEVLDDRFSVVVFE